MKVAHKSTVITTINFKGVKRPCLTPADWMARPIEPADHLLGELFSTTTRALFSADTGVGKTMVGLAWAFAMGLGRDFLHWRAKRRANVLYIDGEMPRQLIQERIALACQSFAVEPADARRVKILSSEDFEDMPPLDTEAGQRWLEQAIDGHGPFDFIVFDNIRSPSTFLRRGPAGARHMSGWSATACVNRRLISWAALC